MTGALDRIAEERLREAIAKGELDDVPGKGQPLELEDLAGLSPELRSSYLLLRNAGVLPEEVELENDMVQLNDLIAAATRDEDRADLRARKSALALRYELLMDARGHSGARSEYGARIRRRLG